MFRQWRDRDRAAYERMHHTITAASAAAASLTSEVTSPDGGVTVRVGGDQRVQAITIDREAYRYYTEDALARTVVAGVMASRRQLAAMQRDRFEREFTEETS